MAKQIMNIINFVRGTEPRLTIDLLGTMENQLREVKRLKLKSTFLIQYDALIDQKFIKAIMPYLDLVEVGLWIELVRTCIEKAGEKWRGEPDWAWDWHGNICNLAGYSPKARERMTDVCMEKFKEVFGYYPSTVGAWAIDAVTLNHLDKKYSVVAACNCKEQWGTDGYTLWGGYYGQGYYPSQYNSLCPAQNKSNQIDIPVFRMLGSDPIYQYDAGLNISGTASEHQPVVTLEPICDDGGADKHWVDWYLKENYNKKCLSFAYAQAGQENSFGWVRMKDGFVHQMQKIKELEERGLIEVMTLKETGVWYKNEFATTPQCSIVAEGDYKNTGKKSYWYCSGKYRMNLYFENCDFWIRDFFIFDEKYPERYLNSICKTEGYVFDNLPVIDGNRFSGNGIRSGLYPVDKTSGNNIVCTADPEYSEIDGSAVIKVNTQRFGKMEFRFCATHAEISMQKNADDFMLVSRRNKAALTIEARIPDQQTLELRYNGYKYSLKIVSGSISTNSNGEYVLQAEKGKISITI